MNKKYTKIIGTIIIPTLTLFAITSCGKAASLTGVTYDSETGKISWSQDKAVQEWKVAVNGKEATVTDTEYVIDSAAAAEGEELDVTITGTSEKGKTVVEETQTIQILPSLEISLIDGKYDWSVSTEELAKYTTEGVSVKYKVVLDSTDKGFVTESNYPVASGQHTVAVKPVLDGNDWYFSQYTKYESKSIATPSNINLAGTKIVWNQVDFFDTVALYKVSVDVVKQDKSTDSQTLDLHTNYFDISNLYEDYSKITQLSVKVQAVSEVEGIISSSESQVFTFKQLAQVINVHYEDGIISWDAVEDATAYEIEEDGKVIDTVTTNSYAYGGNQSHRIRVRAKGDATISYSEWSATATVNTLNKPKPTFTDDAIKWSSVPNASSYKVRLYRYNRAGEVIEKIYDGENLGDIRLFDVASVCTKVGIYKFSVAACPSDGAIDYSMSMYSDELEIVRLGNAEKIRITETNPLNPNGEILVTLIGTYDNARYVASINGVEIGETDENTFSISKPLNAYADSRDGYTSLVLEIHAEPASTADSNDKLYLAAMPDEKMEIELRQLDSPTGLKYTQIGTIDYVTWSTVAEVSGYGILFGSDLRRSTESKFMIPDLQPGTYTVSVFAEGDILKDYKDGSFTMFSDTKFEKELDYNGDLKPLWLTSQYSSAITIKKLDNPTNINIYKNQSKFTWDSVLDVADGYQIYAYPADEERMDYTTVESPVDGVYYTNEASLDITGALAEKGMTKGFAIEIIARGNTRYVEEDEEIILDSNPTSIQNGQIFRWLDTTKVRIQDLNLTWDKKTNASGYRIMNAAENTEYAVTDGTAFAWTDANNFQAGKYEVSVVALANTKGNYFDSPSSESIKFTKLQVPTLQHLYVDGVLDVYNYYIAWEDGCTEYKISISSASSSTKPVKYIKLELDSEGAVIDERLVEIDGVKYIKYNPAADFANMSNPTLTVVAMGDGQKYMASNEYVYTQYTRVMDAPINPTILGHAFVEEGQNKITITSDAVNPNGGKYVFYINNTPTRALDTPEYTNAVGSGAALKITLGFEGKVFVPEGDDYIYYYDSKQSDSAITINFLAKPTGLIGNATKTDEGKTYKLSWNPVNNALYFYEYAIVDAEGNEVLVSAKVTDADHLSAGSKAEAMINVASEYLGQGYKLVVKVYSIGNDYATGEGTYISNLTNPAELTLNLVS